MFNCVDCDTPVPSTAFTNAICADCWVKDNDDKPPCAWCYPGSKGNSIGSHGICAQHSEEMIAEVRINENFAVQEASAQQPPKGYHWDWDTDIVR